MKVNLIIKLVGVAVAFIGGLSVLILSKFSVLTIVFLLLYMLGLVVSTTNQAIASFIGKVIAVFKK